MNSSIIKFSINGEQVTSNGDESIWQVAKRLGIEIPHLCFSSESGYRADGNCRACMVEIDGERVLAASCIRKPTEGMKIITSSERAKKSRELVFELLLTDQPSRNKSHDPNSNFWNNNSKPCIGNVYFSL